MIHMQDGFDIIKEYRISWLLCRMLYAAKLKLLDRFPVSELLFEKTADVKRIDLLRFDRFQLEGFLINLDKESQIDLIRVADQAANGIISGFSNRLLDYGNPLQWNLNPLSGCRTDMKLKWYEIPDFHPVRGDIKIIWEASRFTHFYYFARAYMLTKDKNYYRAFSEQLEHWLEFNPYGYGPNYKCGQECSLRMINALMVYSLFKEYELVTKKDADNVRELIKRCYKKVLSNFFYAHHCIRNNHTLSELCGMIVGAWCCEDEKQLKKAYGWLNQEVDRQFFGDGGYRQYSYTYQRLALQLMEFLAKITDSTKYDLNTKNKEKIINSALMLNQLQNHAGDVPNYGSNDGALIFPVHSCSYRDFRPVVDGIMKCWKGESIYPAGSYEEEALWFLNGRHNLKRAKINQQSRCYAESGCYMMRHNNTMAVLYHQILDSRPAQMDQMHFDLWADHQNILCDSGTYSYAEPEGQRLALTGAHNTIRVFGKEQMKKRGAFFIYGWPKNKIFAADETSVSAQMVSKNGYSHQRTVKYEKNIYIIHDTVKAGERYEILFHTPCKAVLIGNKIELFADEKIAAEIIAEEDADIKIRPCIRSLFYLQKENMTEISISPKREDSITKIVIGGEDNNG